MKTPGVSIIIPTYNRADLLEQGLRSLLSQTFPGAYEIIVVDDGSRDKTRAMVASLQEACPDMIRYLYQTNQGPAAARNAGIAGARGEWIVFIDDDHIAQPDWLEQLTTIPEGVEAIGQCGRNRSTPGKTRVARYCSHIGLHEHPKITPEGWVEHLMTGNAAIRASIIRDVGGFDTRFAAAFKGIAPGGEDTAISLELNRRGLRLSYNPNAVTDHQQKEDLKSLLKENFNFGCNRVLQVYIEGCRAARFPAVWRVLRMAISFIGIPKHILKFRNSGCCFSDSAAFAWFEKCSQLSYTLGSLVGVWNLEKRLVHQ